MSFPFDLGQTDKEVAGSEQALILQETLCNPLVYYKPCITHVPIQRLVVLVKEIERLNQSYYAIDSRKDRLWAPLSPLSCRNINGHPICFAGNIPLGL